jgi:hypothetical protein
MVAPIKEVFRVGARMTLTIIDRDHYSERWIKTEKGKDTVIDLQFARR